MASPKVPDGCPLTPRQFQILQALADGELPKHIAARLDISASGVRTHLHLAYERLDVHGQAQAVAQAGRRGWVSWQPPPPPDPLVERPLLRGYLQALDVWLASGGRDVHAREAMRLALASHRSLLSSKEAA